jgi:hypothetical protein
VGGVSSELNNTRKIRAMAERERFELSRGITPPYRFSKPAPSATWVPLQVGTIG